MEDRIYAPLTHWLEIYWLVYLQMNKKRLFEGYLFFEILFFFFVKKIICLWTG